MADADRCRDHHRHACSAGVSALRRRICRRAANTLYCEVTETRFGNEPPLTRTLICLRALETTTTDTQVRANAYAELIRALGQQQRKLVELREEAAFFKNLATKEPVQGEFRIRNLSVSRGSEPGASTHG